MVADDNTTNSPQPRITDVPAQIFEQFLQTLTEDGVPPEIVGRLRKALLQDGAPTERALREAVFGEEQGV